MIDFTLGLALMKLCIMSLRVSQTRHFEPNRTDNLSVWIFEFSYFFKDWPSRFRHPVTRCSFFGNFLMRDCRCATHNLLDERDEHRVKRG